MEKRMITKGELLRKLSKFPSDAEIIPRSNVYLNKSWLLVKYTVDDEVKSEAIIVE